MEQILDVDDCKVDDSIDEAMDPKLLWLVYEMVPLIRIVSFSMDAFLDYEDDTESTSSRSR
jgi:hypothetical protein